MKSSLECLPCIANQALRAARLATNDPAVQQHIVEETLAGLRGVDLNESPAWLSQPLYAIVQKHSGNGDPYRAQKRAQNDLALSIEADLREMVRSSEEPLETALHLAAAGNVIDLGVNRAEDIDIHAAIEQVMRDRFAIDHSEAFRAALGECKDLLYLLDNAGEIVFDKILIEELIRYTPVTAVVKQGPIINDVLLEDAEYVGLTQVCEVLDNGGPFIGAPLDHVPERFLARMRQADVIVGKGHGNYETIDGFDGDVFLILRAKCNVVASHMGVPLGAMGLISARQRRNAAR